jgi:hypothetical protein
MNPNALKTAPAVTEVPFGRDMRDRLQTTFDKLHTEYWKRHAEYATKGYPNTDAQIADGTQLGKIAESMASVRKAQAALFEVK